MFWRFNGDTWKGGYYGRNIEASALPEPSEGAWDYTVQLEPNERNWLFALDYPASVPPDTRLTMDFQLIRRQPVIQLMQYGVISNPEFVDTPQLRDALRLQALDLPEDRNPRTRQLVEEWRQETPGDPEFVNRALRYFNQERFHYSLEAPLLGTHSVDDFLFDDVLLLVGEDGSVARPNGKPFTQYVWGKIWVNNHAHVLKGSSFSTEQLKILFDQVDIAPFVTGAVQPKLNQGNLKSVPFIIAERSVHSALDQLIEPFFASIRSRQEENQTLAATRDLLLPKLMSGEIRLRDAEAIAEAAT